MNCQHTWPKRGHPIQLQRPTLGYNQAQTITGLAYTCTRCGIKLVRPVNP